MNRSENINELATALAKAQGQMRNALKDTKNEFFKSKYADLASVIEAIRTPMAENGLSYIQTTEPSEKNEVRIETSIFHSSGQWISCGTLAVPVAKADAQGYGSALTYARRYSLSAAFGVASEDDDGNAATKAAPKQERKQAEPPPEENPVEWTEDDVANLHTMCDKLFDLSEPLEGETKAKARCDFYLEQKKGGHSPEKVINRMATVIQALTDKHKKAMGEV